MTYPSLDLNGKTAVVIGGTAGIGRAIAVGMASAGANVVPTGRHREQASAVVRDIEVLGRRTLSITATVSHCTYKTPTI